MAGKYVKEGLDNMKGNSSKGKRTDASGNTITDTTTTTETTTTEETNEETNYVGPIVVRYGKSNWLYDYNRTWSYWD